MKLPNVNYHPEKPIPWFGNRVERVQLYLDNELRFVSSKEYSVDRAATSCRDRGAYIISKYSASENFDPMIPYLALNYLDRCIELTKNDLDEAELLAISCLVLAWKMIDFNFDTAQFLCERSELGGLSLDQLIIKERQILEKLDGCLQPVTAFSFVGFINATFEMAKEISKDTIREIIIYAQYDTGITKYRPSVIAASAFLAASDFLFPDLLIHFFLEISCDPRFEESKSEIKACTEFMIRGCHDLKLTIESASHPKISVKAGHTYHHEHEQGEPSSPAMDSPIPNKCSPGPSDRKGKKKMYAPLIVPAAEEDKDSKEEEQFWLVHEYDQGEPSSPAMDSPIPNKCSPGPSDQKGKKKMYAPLIVPAAEEDEDSDEEQSRLVHKLIRAREEEKGKALMLCSSPEQSVDSQDELLSEDELYSDDELSPAEDRRRWRQRWKDRFCRNGCSCILQ